MGSLSPKRTAKGAEEEAIANMELEAGELRKVQIDSLSESQIDTILYKIFPSAIERQDKKVVQACEVALAKYGYLIPNPVSDKWKPSALGVPRNEVDLRERYADRMGEFGLTIVKSHEAAKDMFIDTEREQAQKEKREPVSKRTLERALSYMERNEERETWGSGSAWRLKADGKGDVA